MRFRVHGVNLISKALNCSSRNPLPVPHFRRSIQGVVAVLHLHVPGSVSSENPNFKVSKRWHVGHSHPHDHDHDNLTGKEGEKIFLIGLAADIGLAAGKGVTGYLSGSTAIIADAVHSVSDVVLSGIALVSYRVARAPKDKEHPYGHGKFETLGALGVSSMLLVTAGGIAWHTLDLLMVLLSATPDAVNQSLCTLDYDRSHHHVGHHHGIDMKHPVLALNMTVVSILTKEGLYWITKRAGERVGSGLMKANAWHHRADAISSVVALIGVGGSILGVKFLDPLAGLLVSGMILKVGLETGYQSVMELVDAAVPLECLDPIKQTIVLVERVKGCHHLRGRRAGSSLYLDVHIEVDPFSSVSAAHDIGETVRKQIHASHREVSEVFIHIDPSISYLSSGMEDQWDNSQSNVYLENAHVDDIVNSVLSSKFSKRMVVEHITHHFLQGKILLQVEVSMPSDLVIRDAKWMAGEAETEILKAASNISRVSILLRLHNPGAPQFQQTKER